MIHLGNCIVGSSSNNGTFILYMYLAAEVSLKEKEVELNMVIEELRKNFTSVQLQLAKEQSEKSVRKCHVLF